MKSHPVLLAAGLVALIASAVAQPAPAADQPKPPPKTPEQRAQDDKIRTAKLIAQLPPGTTQALDVGYVDGAQAGKDPDSIQTLDLLVPPGPGPFPLLIWIHGGGWHAGSKEPFVASFASKFFPKGFAVAGVDYRFVQDAPFPAQIEDCDAAIVWLRKHAAQYHLDPDRFGVFGHSAGAHLAALVAVTGDGAKFSKDPVSARVQAAVCWATPADLDRDRGHWPPHAMLWNPKDPFFKFFPNGTYDTAFAQMASPASYVHAGIPPMLIVHGAKDNLVPLGQVQVFVDNLKKAGVDVTLRIDPNHGHDVMGSPSPEEALAFFQRTLEPPAAAK